MAQTPIKHPHDFLVKAALGRQEVMKDFLENRLSTETLKHIDLHTLRLANKNFAPRSGKNKHSDLICAATIGQQELSNVYDKKIYLYIFNY